MPTSQGQRLQHTDRSSADVVASPAIQVSDCGLPIPGDGENDQDGQNDNETDPDDHRQLLSVPATVVRHPATGQTHRHCRQLVASSRALPRHIDEGSQRRQSRPMIKRPGHPPGVEQHPTSLSLHDARQRPRLSRIVRCWRGPATLEPAQTLVEQMNIYGRPTRRCARRLERGRLDVVGGEPHDDRRQYRDRCAAVRSQPSSKRLRADEQERTPRSSCQECLQVRPPRVRRPPARSDPEDHAV
jgi:hypothetical protein